MKHQQNEYMKISYFAVLFEFSDVDFIHYIVHYKNVVQKLHHVYSTEIIITNIRCIDVQQGNIHLVFYVASTTE